MNRAISDCPPFTHVPILDIIHYWITTRVANKYSTKAGLYCKCYGSFLTLSGMCRKDNLAIERRHGNRVGAWCDAVMSLDRFIMNARNVLNSFIPRMR